jgi:ATP-dependent RNA helicase SUPV3L1/SUV3
VADEVKSLDQNARAQLRKYGVRFGAFNIYFPLLLKPAPAELALTLWVLKHGAAHGLDRDALPEPPRAGLTSVAVAQGVPEPFYRVFGYHVCGPRAVRIDILERLADLIRPLLAWRQSRESPSQPPKGSTGDGGFTVIPEMMSILGCSPDEVGNVLKALGFRMERRPVRPFVMPQPRPSAADAAVAAAVALAAPPAAAPEPAGSIVAAGEAETAPPDQPEGGSDAAAGKPATATEPAMEEVWRPRRHRREDHPHREQRRGERQGRDRHRGRDRQPPAAPSVQAAPVEGGPQPAPAVAASEPQPDRQDQRDRPRHDRDRRWDRNKEQQRDGARRDPRQDRDRPGRGEFARGEDRRKGTSDDRRRREERGGGAQVRSASPPKKGGADPDSPFAALGALKQALEKQSQDQKV